MRHEPQGRVLVIGDDMRIFLAVSRSLGRAGKEVHAVPFNWHAPALKSRYITKIHHVPRYSDDPGGWRKAVAEIIDACSIDLVIPCCDRAILPLHAHRDDFGMTRLAIPNPIAMELMFDKAATRAMATALQVPVVAGGDVTRGDTADALIRRFGLPLVIKARNSFTIDRLETWGKVWIITEPTQLEEVLNDLPHNDRYLAESYFVGSGVGLSVLANEGKILQAFQHRRLREGWGGSSSYRVSEPVDSELYAAAGKICAHTGLTGVCMFEFRYNLQSRNWVLLETNARFWGSMPLPLSLGLDFPVYLFDLLVHGKTHPRVSYPAGIRARNILLDGMNLFAQLRRTGMRELLPWCRDLLDFAAQPLWLLTGAERSDSFVRDDLRPGIWEAALVFRSLYDKYTRHGEFGGNERRTAKIAAHAK